MSFHVPNKFRVRGPGSGFPPHLWSEDDIGNCGAFVVKLKLGQTVRVIASDGEGWEHVSVSRTDRCPTWDEMCQVKALFWDDEDAVMQLHPPCSEYVNNHPYCLHLWRPTDCAIPLPDPFLVGIKGVAA